MSTRFTAAALSLALMGSAGAAPQAATAADEISDGQWYVKELRLDQAHKLTKGKGVLIALIDTGVDPTHPDIAGSVVAGTEFTIIQTGGDGLFDDDGHGTAMAGLLVGHGRTRGVAPEATVMSIRTITRFTGSPTHLGRAINWAVEHGATVISVSQAPPHDVVLKQAVEAALGRDVVIVAGAGNVDKNLTVGHPAAYPGVLAVGGTSRGGAHCPAAIRSPKIEISAPCDRVSTPYLNHQRGVGNGTSNSTALVAGAAALVRAKYPHLSQRDVVHRLTATAIDKGPVGRDDQFGFGSLNVVAALTADITPLPPLPSSAAPSFTPGPPLAAPGAEFPVALAVSFGAGLLTVILTIVAAVMLVAGIRRRRATAPSTHHHH